MYFFIKSFCKFQNFIRPYILWTAWQIFNKDLFHLLRMNKNWESIEKTLIDWFNPIHKEYFNCIQLSNDSFKVHYSLIVSTNKQLYHLFLHIRTHSVSKSEARKNHWSIKDSLSDGFDCSRMTTNIFMSTPNGCEKRLVDRIDGLLLKMSW
jgi:hypothetical protein